MFAFSHFVLSLFVGEAVSYKLTNSQSEGRCRLQIFGSWLQFGCVYLDCCFGGPYHFSVALHIFIQLAWRLPTIVLGFDWCSGDTLVSAMHASNLRTMVVHGPFPAILYEASCESCKMLLNVSSKVTQ